MGRGERWLHSVLFDSTWAYTSCVAERNAGVLRCAPAAHRLYQLVPTAAGRPTPRRGQHGGLWITDRARRAAHSSTKADTGGGDRFNQIAASPDEYTALWDLPPRHALPGGGWPNLPPVGARVFDTARSRSAGGRWETDGAAAPTQSGGGAKASPPAATPAQRCPGGRAFKFRTTSILKSYRR